MQSLLDFTQMESEAVARQNWVGALGDSIFGTGDSGHFVSQLPFNERLLRTISVDPIGETSCVQWWVRRYRCRARGRSALRGLPFVAVMKTADFRNHDDWSSGRR